MLLGLMFMVAGGMNIVAMEFNPFQFTEKEEKLLERFLPMERDLGFEAAVKTMLMVEPDFGNILCRHLRLTSHDTIHLWKDFLWLESRYGFDQGFKTMLSRYPNFEKVFYCTSKFREHHLFALKRVLNAEKSCEICCESKARYNFIKPLSCCAYSESCIDCLLELIGASLQEKTVAHINCPNRKCGKSINEQDIRVITQNHPEVYKTFCEIATRELINKDNRIKHCPTPNCPFSFENDQKLKQAFTCPSCKQRYCSDCLVQHAPEMTCEQAREHAQLIGDKTKVDRANEEWLQKNTKACPQCKASVEKNGGCYHMKCLQCKHQFCWKCLNPHDHTTRHPCGVWENDAQMNQAHQLLIGQGQGQPNGMNPLYMAAQHGHADIVRLLIQAGADVNQAQPNGVDPLLIAVQHNNVEAMHLLLEAGADVNQAQPLANNQPHQQPNNIPFMFIQPQIIQPGANVNLLVNRNRRQRNEEVQPIANNNLQQLYQHILPPQIQQPIPIDQLLQQHQQRQQQLQQAENNNALILAVRNNNPVIVRALLQQPEINVNMQDENGMNLLHIAAQQGNVDIARLLLAHPNIFVNAQDANGMNAHAIALQQGHADMVALLNDDNERPQIIIGPFRRFL